MKKNVLKYLIIAALFAALITVTTGFIGHIPIGTAGGYLHFRCRRYNPAQEVRARKAG